MNPKLLKRSLLSGLFAPVAYIIVRQLVAMMGYDLFPPFLSLPAALFEWWPVVPGAVVLSYYLSDYLSRVPLRHLNSKARWAGVGAALLNVPVSVLLALIGFHLSTPWRYGFVCLLEEWVRCLPVMILFASPVAVPLGVLFGSVFGWLERRDRMSEPVTPQTH